MNLSEFNYYLPEELIAQVPLKKRSDSRLLVLDKDSGDVEHKSFIDVLKHFEKGDCLVLNDTRVIPARLIGKKEGSGGKIEVVLLKKNEDNIWEVILKPGKKAKIGARFVFGKDELVAEARKYGIMFPEWETAKKSLIEKKLLNKRGAITNEGKNLAPERWPEP